MENRYTRRIVFCDHLVEVVEIKWPPGAGTKPHDHGRSHGTIFVLEGVVQEEVHEGGGAQPRIRTFAAGANFWEYPGVVHTVGNPSSDSPARTLHIYRPPLESV